MKPGKGVKLSAGKSPRFVWAAPRTPIHPGHFLDTRYLQPGKISQNALASSLSDLSCNSLIYKETQILPYKININIINMLCQ